MAEAKKEQGAPIVEVDPYAGKTADELYTILKSKNTVDEKTGKNPIVERGERVRQHQLDLEEVVKKQLKEIHGTTEEGAPKGRSVKNDRKKAQQVLHNLVYAALKKEHGKAAADLYIKDPEYIENEIAKLTGGKGDYNTVLKQIMDSDDILDEKGIVMGMVGALANKADKEGKEIQRLEHALISKYENQKRFVELAGKDIGVQFKPHATPEYVFAELQRFYQNKAAEFKSREDAKKRGYIAKPEEELKKAA